MYVWATHPGAAYDASLVARIYAEQLAPDAPSSPARRGPSAVQELEASGYLERYLWPHFSIDAPMSAEHVLSVLRVRRLFLRNYCRPARHT